METVVHNIRDLSGSERSAAEELVGHELRENQQLIIQVVSFDLTDRQKTNVADGGLPDWCNVYEGLTEAEIANLEQSIVRDRSSRSFD